MAIYTLNHLTPELGENTWVADSAEVIGQVITGQNVSIWFGAVIRGDSEPIRIGRNTNIQDNAVLHNDIGIPLTVGENVTVGHSAMLHGCEVGDGSLIGIMATVLNNVVIGKYCLIGANTMIPEGRVIPDRSLVVGTPGRIIRSLSDEEISGLLKNAEGYVKNAVRFRTGLKRIG